MQSLNSLNEKVQNLEERMDDMETLIRGDGQKSGIGPIAIAAHQKGLELEGDNEKRDGRIDALERNNIKMAGWVGGAVFVAGLALKVVIPLLNKLLPSVVV
jgi:hypothetical protein